MSQRRLFRAFIDGNAHRKPVMDDSLSSSMEAMRVSDSSPALARRKQDQLTGDLHSMHLAPKAQSLLEAVTLNAFVERFSKTRNAQASYIYAHSVMVNWVRTHVKRGPTTKRVTTKLRQRRFRG